MTNDSKTPETDKAWRFREQLGRAIDIGLDGGAQGFEKAVEQAVVLAYGAEGDSDLLGSFAIAYTNPITEALRKKRATGSVDFNFAEFEKAKGPLKGLSNDYLMRKIRNEQEALGIKPDPDALKEVGEASLLEQVINRYVSRTK